MTDTRCFQTTLLSGTAHVSEATVRVWTDFPWFAGVLWAAVVLLTAGLVSLAWTRWGQTKPFHKALGLSVLAHLVLVGFAATVQIVSHCHELMSLESAVCIDIVDGAATDTASRVEPEQRPSPRKDLSVGPEVAGTLAVWDPRTFQKVIPLPTVALDATAPAAEIIMPTASLARLFPDMTEEFDARWQREAAPRMPDERPLPPSVTPRESMLALDAADTPADEAIHEADPTAMAVEPVDDVASSPRPEESAAPLGPADTPERHDLLVPTLATHAPLEPLASDGLTVGRPVIEGPPAAEGPPFRMASLEHLRDPSLVGRRELRSEPAPANQAVDAQLPASPRDHGSAAVPAWYALRTAGDRLEKAAPFGATRDTEEAVRAALEWLAANQNDDGRWEAARHGAGREDFVAGRYRASAGARADAGVTGLALLAFLASGNTHRAGGYQWTVSRGLNFLLRCQTPDGCMAGDALHYERMYCHAMATLAVCDAYVLTGDTALQEPLRRAVRHTMAMQNPQTGGWRYVQGEDGDMSQFGWQLLVLKSAEQAGLLIPSQVNDRARSFLASHSTGRSGGLSFYRAGYPVSRPMTAEALLARILLGEPLDSPAIAEANTYLLGELPGPGIPNLYYWYYATLALHHQQNNAWRVWNQSLQARLLALQEKRSPYAGSWSPQTVWGGYGGRVYTTAMAALCLEAYYRYTPARHAP